MRGRGFTIPTNFIGSHASRNSPSLFSPFSTSAGGRGRGSGSGGGGRGQIFTPGQFSFTADTPAADEEKRQSAKTEQPPVAGLGHGRGKPLPEFSSFISTLKRTADPAVGRGRGVGAAEGPRPSRPAGEKVQQTAPGQPPKSSVPSNEPYLPSSLRSTLHSFGRGKSDVPVAPGIPEKEVNRHIRSPRVKPRADGDDDGVAGEQIQRRPRFNQDSSSAAAVGERRGGAEGSEGRRRGGEGGMQQMGGRGRGMGMGRGRGRGRERGEYGGRGRGDIGGEDSDEGDEIELGNNADGEKLAQTVGVEFMNELVDGFEEMGGRVLPSPLEDEFLDALDLNFKIEFEEEYMFGEFDLNPDIDEKPPMPLRDMLEKVKPFLMSYEGIQSQAEWEEVMEETMKNVPLLKKIVDHYAGPDRVTAKQQQQELERVAGTLPAIAPPSVKRFADRAVMSLQSNPGWGFDKKCQFMDKLVMQVSQHYK